MKIINVMASSLDGRIGATIIEGDEDRLKKGISSAEDQAHLRREIAQSDAIFVGASSIRANQECLHHLGANGRPPTWYIFATSPIPKHFPFWQQNAIKRVILADKDLPIYNEQVSLEIIQGGAANFAYRLAQAAGHRRVLLFGGGIVNSWFYAEKLVDELVLTLAPKIIAFNEAPYLVEPTLPQPVGLKLVSSQVTESFVFLRYTINF